MKKLILFLLLLFPVQAFAGNSVFGTLGASEASDSVTCSGGVDVHVYEYSGTGNISLEWREPDSTNWEEVRDTGNPVVYSADFDDVITFLGTTVFRLVAPAGLTSAKYWFNCADRVR